MRTEGELKCLRTVGGVKKIRNWGEKGLVPFLGGETFVTGWGQYPITCHVRVALNLISVEVLMLKAFCLIVGSNA